MNGVKEYKIVINGIEESIKAVDSLNSQLDALAKKIKDLQGSKVNVATGGGSSSKSSADDKLYDKIEQTQERITQANSEDYQILLQKKAELKEIEKTQKAIFAGIQAEGKEYANTLNGQRQRLADMKAALGNIELGSPEFDKQVQEIDKLNNKIKEIEQSYGQYGRNVGNYANSVADGLQKVVIKVGEGERTFNSARDALRSLGNELKSMAVNGEQGTKAYSDLNTAFKQLQSTMKDVSASSQAMDNLLDAAQGLTAIGSIGQGFSTLFGFDDSEIQKNIQNLVALQNALKGIETIRKQMDTNEGIGRIINKMSDAADMAAVSISKNFTDVKIAEEGIVASSERATKAVKGLATAFKAIGVGVLMYAISKAADQFKSLLDRFGDAWHRTFGELATAEEQVEIQMQSLNAEYEKRNNLIEKALSSGQISKEEAISKQFQNQNKYLEKQIDLLGQRNKITFGDIANVVKSGLKGDGAFAVGDIIEKFTDYKVHAASAKKTTEELAESIKSIGDEVKTANVVVQSDAAEFVSRWIAEVAKFSDGTEESNKKLKEFKKELDDKNSVINSVIMNIHKYFPNSEWAKAIDNAIGKVYEFENAMNGVNVDFLSKIHSAMDKDYQKMVDIEEAQKELVRLRNAALPDATKEANVRVVENYIQWLQDGTKEAQKEIKGGGKTTAATVKNVEIDIANARVQAMRDGFVKTMAQLQLERNKRIEEARKSGKMVEEQIALINKEYENKILDAREQYYKERLSQAESFAEEMKNLEKETTEIIYRINDLSRDIQKGHIESNALEVVAGYSSTYDAVARLIYNSERGMEAVKNLGDEVLAEWERLDAQVTLTSNILLRFEEDNGGKNQIINGMNYDQALVEWDNAIKAYEKFVNEYTELQSHTITELESKDELGFSWRYEAREKFYNSILNLEKEQNKNELAVTRKRIEEETKLLTEEEKKRHEAVYGRLTPDNMGAGGLDSSSEEEISAWLDSLEAAYKNGEILFEDYVKTTGATAIQGYAEARQELRNYLLMTEDERAKSQVSEKELQDNLQHQYEEYIKNIEKEATLHQGRLRAIQREGELKQQKATQDTNEKTRQITANYYGNIEKEFENTLSSISRKISNIPQKNALGFINYGATKKELKELEKSVDNTLADIKRKREELIEDRTAKRISFEDFDVAMANLDALESQATETGKEIGDKLSSLVTEQIKAINDILQAVGQSFGQIFQSFSEMQQNQYEAMIDEQEKYIDEYEKLLDKQRDITQDYADKVNDIEDELSTARGDRRQQLIDHLNAEMAAQRASMAQEKKLEKEKEKAEKKRKKLEYEAAVARKKADLVQAAINAAMAVSMAAVNKWPIPAIPMMALAAAVGAAQIAAVKSQRIPQYATGGVLVGKSHREGGIKVLGGAAEVEGGEYITNKKSTAANVDLLTFINSKKRKVNLDELIEFYGNNKQIVKNNLKTKFEDGGVIPMIDSTINDGDRLLSAFEAYSNRPVYVSVVDINDKQADVRNVQVLAGL